MKRLQIALQNKCCKNKSSRNNKFWETKRMPRETPQEVSNIAKPGANPTKLFFFVDEEFFPFLLLSLAVVKHSHFFSYTTNSQA